jgi:hypothetical protein
VHEQLLGLLPAVGGLLLQAAHDDGAQLRGNRGALLGDGLGRLGDVGAEDLLGAAAGEGRAAREQLVPQGAHGVDVGPVVDVLVCGRLLRCHVGGRAQGDAGGGELVPARGIAHGLGHPEVGDPGMAAAEQDVVGLDVPVHHAHGVGRGQGVHHLLEDLRCLWDGKLAFPDEALPEGLALEIGHDVVEEAVGLTRVEEGKDVGMLQVGGDLHLLEEALRPHGGGQLGTKHLEGHLAVVLEVSGQVDGGHAARPDLPLDGIPIPQGLAETMELGVAHGTLPGSA